MKSRPEGGEPREDPAPRARTFRDHTEASGLADWRSVYGPPVDKLTILETMGAGVALVDLDTDGYLDVYAVTGRRRSPRDAVAFEPAGTPAMDGTFGTSGVNDTSGTSRATGAARTEMTGSIEARNGLFRGAFGARFSAAPPHAGAALEGWFYGVAAADFDNDGFVDLYVTAWGEDRLLRNLGDGTFVDVAGGAGIRLPGWSTGAAFADVDDDGWLDLFVAGYVELDPTAVPLPGSGPYCRWKNVGVPCGPRGLPGARAALLHGSGDGTFRPAQADVVGRPGYYGLGAVWGDYDDDGDPDLYVADDQTPNRLFRNDGGSLVELGELSGAAYSEDGRPEAGMGTDWGDADGDGRLDLFVTNFADESNTLYVNAGDDLFVDSTYAAGLGIPSFRYLSWGTAFRDLDADGDGDLFVASGHVYPQVDTHKLADSYPQRNQVFLNLLLEGPGSDRAQASAGAVTSAGSGPSTDAATAASGNVPAGTSGARREPAHGAPRFRELEPVPGDGLQVAQVSRGAAFGDVDGDADVDVLVGNLDDRPQLLLNELPQGGSLVVRLAGRRANRSAVGARAEVTTPDGHRQVAEVGAGHSYLSSSSFALHFGLGTSATARLRVRWPGSGWSETVEAPAGARVLWVEGSSPLVLVSGAVPQEPR